MNFVDGIVHFFKICSFALLFVVVVVPSVFAQGICLGGDLAGQVCSSDPDCFACSGPFQGQACSTDLECLQEGICVPNFGEACFFGNDCSPGTTCNNAPGSCDTSPTCDLSLPVELQSLLAKVDGSSVILEWKTASETNNAGFYVERFNGETGDEPGWLDIGFVEGHGTTEIAQLYEYQIDNMPAGMHRFRLKQIDFDGTFEYLSEVEALVEVPGRFVLEPAYPNPFNPSTTIRFAVSVEQMVVAVLHDASGKLVRELYRGSSPANEMQTLRIDGTGLASGTYHVSLKGETFTASERVTLVK